MPWEAAFVLGAIVSPTDPLAATAIMRRLDAPRRLVSSIEGEGLFNDATALVAYRVAVGAVVGGSFSLADAGLRSVLGAAGGVAIGLAVGWAIAEIRKRTLDTQRDDLAAHRLCGLRARGRGRRLRGPGSGHGRDLPGHPRAADPPGPHPPAKRLRLGHPRLHHNAILFVLIGLQLRAVVGGLSGYSASTLVGYGLAASGMVVGTRLAWFFTVPYLMRAIDRRPAQRARRVSAANRFVVAWSGLPADAAAPAGGAARGARTDA